MNGERKWSFVSCKSYHGPCIKNFLLSCLLIHSLILIHLCMGTVIRTRTEFSVRDPPIMLRRKPVHRESTCSSEEDWGRKETVLRRARPNDSWPESPSTEKRATEEVDKPPYVVKSRPHIDFPILSRKEICSSPRKTSNIIIDPFTT